MGNTKAKRTKFELPALLLVVFVGASFIAIGLFFFFITQPEKGWITVKSTVASVNQSTDSDGDTMYSPTAQYTVNGQIYSARSVVSSSSSPSVGSEIEVAYNPANPAQGKVLQSTGDNALILLFPAVGALTILFSVVAFSKSVRRTNEIKRLVASGTRVQGIITNVLGSGSSGSRSNSSFSIVVSATNLQGTVQEYKSDGISGSGAMPLVHWQENPIPVGVYVDMLNPQSYYVDINDLPELGAKGIVELIKEAVSAPAIGPNSNEPQDFTKQ